MWTLTASVRLRTFQAHRDFVLSQPKGKNSYKAFMKERVAAEKWLKQQKVKSFYDSVVCHDLKQGIASLMQVAVRTFVPLF